MAIDATCQCGNTFTVNGKYAGTRVRCPVCKFPVLVASPRHDAKAGGMPPFEDRLLAQVDYLGGIALTIARRLGWCVLLLALLVGGCVNTLRILHDR